MMHGQKNIKTKMTCLHTCFLCLSLTL